MSQLLVAIVSQTGASTSYTASILVVSDSYFHHCLLQFEEKDVNLRCENFNSMNP